MASLRKKFLQELIRQHDPARSNTDVEDVAAALGIGLDEAELQARLLEEEGYLATVGLGGNVAPAAKGREAAEDPDWD